MVKVRWTPYWSIEEGTGCVEESHERLHPGDRAASRGAFRIGVDFSSALRALDGGAALRRPSAAAGASGWEEAVK